MHEIRLLELEPNACITGPIWVDDKELRAGLAILRKRVRDYTILVLEPNHEFKWLGITFDTSLALNAHAQRAGFGPSCTLRAIKHDSGSQRTSSIRDSCLFRGYAQLCAIIYQPSGGVHLHIEFGA